MHLDTVLHQAVAVLAAAVAAMFVCARLRVPANVGLILTGLLIGPSGFAFVAEAEQVEVLAEIGVMLLLFVIGLELSFGQLKALGRAFLVGGSLQAMLTLAAVATLAMIWMPSGRQAVFAGMVIALSSTAVVLKRYEERRETDTPQGQAVLGVLLFQDFLIVPLIVLTPVLAGRAGATPADLALRFGGALAAIVAVALAARYAMPWLLHQLVLTRLRELFVLASLLSCLAMAWFTHSLGFSLALGAFLAGILISETEYGHQVIADVVPIRDVFSSVFFLSIGMLVDWSFASERLGSLLGLAAGVVLVKAIIAGGAIRLAGYPLRIAVIGGLGLAQMGEFGFLLMEVGVNNDLLDPTGFQTLLVVAVMTLLLTPILIEVAPAVGQRLAGWFGQAPSDDDGAEPSLSGHVVVVGYGHSGQLLTRVLGEARIRFVVIELNARTVREAKRDGLPIFYGDATRREILDHAGVSRAQAVVFVMSDASATRRGVRLVRDLNPRVDIMVRTRTVSEIVGLREAGAGTVVAEEFESAIELFTLVLGRFHVPRNVIRAQTRLLRGEGYRMLRSPAMNVSDQLLAALEHGTTDIYQVGETSRAQGSTLRGLNLRHETGVSVVAVVRGETSYANPSPELGLEVGDCLVLVGGHAEIDRAFVFLDTPGESAPPDEEPPASP